MVFTWRRGKSDVVWRLTISMLTLLLENQNWGNWLDFAPILGNRWCPQGWTGSENRLGKLPNVFKVHGRTVSRRHPMEKNTSLPHDNYELALRRLGGTEHRLLKKPDIGRAYKDYWGIQLKGVHQKNPNNEGSTHGKMVASPFSKCEAGEDNQTRFRRFCEVSSSLSKRRDLSRTTAITWLLSSTFSSFSKTSRFSGLWHRRNVH